MLYYNKKNQIETKTKKKQNTARINERLGKEKHLNLL